jgi:diadenosine tetraphosphate (Ap4A) HIT family hydrolase
MPDPHPNATLLKFGYPDSLIHEGRFWAVLVRPAQPTLGSLILCTRGEETAYGDLGPQAFAEQRELVTRIERTLKSFSRFERINYLMLMMVDPHVHFHVLPRYSDERQFDGLSFPDHGWPGLPELGKSVPGTLAITDAIRREWQLAAG